MSQILEKIKEYNLLQEQISNIERKIGSTVSYFAKKNTNQQEVGYFAPPKNASYGDWNMDYGKKHETELTKLTQSSKALSESISTDSIKYMFCEVSNPYNSILNFTYIFPNSKDHLIMIPFTVNLKKNIDNNMFLTVKASYGHQFSTNVKTLVSLFDKNNKQNNTDLVVISDLNENSLPGFLKKCSEIFLNNVVDFIKKSRQPNLVYDEKMILNLKNHFAFLHSKLYDVVTHKDELDAKRVLMPYGVNDSEIKELISYSIDKEKENLFHTLENNLVASSEKTKSIKI